MTEQETDRIAPFAWGIGSRLALAGLLSALLWLAAGWVLKG